MSLVLLPTTRVGWLKESVMIEIIIPAVLLASTMTYVCWEAVYASR